MIKELAADLPHFLTPSSSSYPPSHRNHRRCLLRSAFLLFFSSPTSPLWLFAFSIIVDHPTTLSLHTTAMAGRLLRPWLIFLPDPPSAFLLSLSSTGDLPCSLFFLYCRSLPTGAAMAGSVVLPKESLISPSPPYFPPMPLVTAHFFYLRTLYSRKHSHGDEHITTMMVTSVKKEVTNRMMKRTHRILRSMVLPIRFCSLILEKFKK